MIGDRLNHFNTTMSHLLKIRYNLMTNNRMEIKENSRFNQLTKNELG